MVTWNVDVVLDYFTSAGDNKGLPLNDLAGKISMLVMLSTMCRLSGVSQLDINNMTETPNFLEFRLDTPTKTFTEYNMAFGGSGLQTLTLHRFVDDERLCPVQVILKYISRTAGFRGQVHRLFVIVGEWSKQASMQSISCWTKLILNKAGLGKFTVHSGRSASSSYALLLGMPIDAILRHAGWKSKSSFVRRYMKHPLRAVTDKHGFSKVWGSKLGECVTPSIDGRVQHFLAHSQVDDVFCRENQKEDAITSISATELRQCPSSLIQTGKLQQSLKAPQPTLELTSCPVLQKMDLTTDRLLNTSPLTLDFAALSPIPRPSNEGGSQAGPVHTSSPIPTPPPPELTPEVNDRQNGDPEREVGDEIKTEKDGGEAGTSGGGNTQGNTEGNAPQAQTGADSRPESGSGSESESPANSDSSFEGTWGGDHRLFRALC